jgi:hypothetical protein
MRGSVDRGQYREATGAAEALGSRQTLPRPCRNGMARHGEGGRKAMKAPQETGPLLFWCLDARRSPGSIEIPNGKWDSG